MELFSLAHSSLACLSSHQGKGSPHHGIEELLRNMNEPKICSCTGIKRPVKVRILGKVWSVEYVKEGKIPLELYGTADLSELAIVIQDGLPESLEQDTCLHEVLHAIDHSLDLELTEVQIGTLGCVLLQVFKDNPEFMKYLSK